MTREMKSKSMKRRFLIIGFSAILALSAPCLWKNTLIHAEELVQEEATVTVATNKGGDILVDVTEGHAGDKVTARVSPNVLYKVESVKVNGVNITANEEGNYEFLLAAGENTIEASFAVDNAELETIAGLLTDAKNKDWDSIFNLSNLLTFISWGVSLLLGSGFFITLIRSKKIKVKTMKEVEEAWNTVVNNEVGKTIGNFLQDTIKPLVEKYNLKTEELQTTMKTLARCVVLMQEDTPEARLAIINELTEFKSVNSELTEEVKKIIDTEIAKSNQDKAELSKAIEELKAANNEIKVEEDKGSGDGRYGKI